MTIYLFGDSYVEAESAESLNVRDHKRWYDLLSEMMLEPHENLGKCGEGPINTLAKFQKRFESQWFDEDDKFVFVLSSLKSYFNLPLTDSQISEGILLCSGINSDK